MNAYDIFAQRILAPLMLRIVFYECSIVVVHCKNDKALVKWFRDDMVPCVSFSSSKMFLDYLMSSIVYFQVEGKTVKNPYFKCTSMTEALVIRDLISI